MPKKSLATAIVLAVGATVSLALLGGAGPQDGRPPGPGGPPGGGPGGFGPGTFLAPRILELADADKDGRLSPDEAARAAEAFVREADAKKAGSIDAETLGRAMNRQMGPPPGFGPDGPGGGDPDGPPGPGAEDFGPGTFLAPGILEAADADKDKKLSPEEAATAARTFLQEIDAKKVGSIDAVTLGEAMNRRMGPPGGFGPGGPMGGERALVKEYDKDGNKRLDAEERIAAREAIKKDREKGGGRRPGFGPPGGGRPGGFGGREEEKAGPGPRVARADAESFPGESLYDPTVLRTLFLDFEGDAWEAEMADFYHTDVEMPASLFVDGKTYPGVGVHFRGLSSFMGVGEGHKRSLNVSLDFTDAKQRLDGYKTLNLLNSHEDPTFLHSVLYLHIARQYTAAPKANFVKVVINGESWGLYGNAQQFDKTFLEENFKDDGGVRWKVPGNPGGDGGLAYLGESVEDYRSRYQIKTKDDAQDWKALINLCKTLDQTPPDRLEEALAPMLDIDGALWFLALENVFINGDGYWVRASDYSIARDRRGVFHIIPHDANETFGPAMGPGMGRGGFGRGGRGGGRPGAPGGGDPGGPPGGGPGGARTAGGLDLDPLVGLDDARKPLRSRLLAVPALKARYLDHVRTLATDWLDWDKLGPVVARYRALIEPEVRADTRKLSSFEAFEKSTGDAAPDAAAEPPRGRPSPSLREFAAQRRKFLLESPALKEARP